MEALPAVLERVLEQLGIEHELPGWRAVAEWDGLVGARVARRTRAVAWRDGVLVVEVDGSAWMHELGFLKRELMARVRSRTGADVRDIRFVVPRVRSFGPGGNRSGAEGS